MKELLKVLWSTLREMVDSKKAVTAFAAVVVNLVVYLGVDLSQEMKLELTKNITYVILVYLGAQGVVDAKKVSVPKEE